MRVSTSFCRLKALLSSVWTRFREILVIMPWGICINALRLRWARGSWLILGLPRLLAEPKLAVGRRMERASSLWTWKAVTLRLGMLILSVLDRRLRRSSAMRIWRLVLGSWLRSLRGWRSWG